MGQGGDTRRGAAAGQRGPTRGPEDLALPSAPGHLCRRHFAFHSVSPPPPPSAAGFPDVGISRRRLRGGRGLGASGRPAGPRWRAFRLWSPETEARSPAAPSRGECRPESGVCFTTFWLRTETRPRAGRGERGSHQERAVNGAARPRTS